MGNCEDVIVFQSTRDKNRPYMWPTRRKGVLGAGELFLGQSVQYMIIYGLCIF